MVNYSSPQLDRIFHSLADPTRRDILRRLAGQELSVSDIARPYQRTMSLPAISKHLRVLEEARLIHKRRAGKHHYIAPSPPALEGALSLLNEYRYLWEERLDRLAAYVEKDTHIRNGAIKK